MSCPEGAHCLKEGSNSGLRGALPAASLQARGGEGTTVENVPELAALGPRASPGKGQRPGEGSRLPAAPTCGQGHWDVGTDCWHCKGPRFHSQRNRGLGRLGWSPIAGERRAGAQTQLPTFWSRAPAPAQSLRPGARGTTRYLAGPMSC